LLLHKKYKKNGLSPNQKKNNKNKKENGPSSGTNLTSRKDRDQKKKQEHRKLENSRQEYVENRAHNRDQKILHLGSFNQPHACFPWFLPPLP
jgi:hypothetical protein